MLSPIKDATPGLCTTSCIAKSSVIQENLTTLEAMAHE